MLGLLISPPPHPSHFPNRSPSNLVKIQTPSCHLPRENLHITSFLLQCKPILFGMSLFDMVKIILEEWAEDSEGVIAASSRVNSQSYLWKGHSFCAFPYTLIPVDSHLFTGTETFDQLIGECLRKWQWKLSFNSESISNTDETVWVLGFHVISRIEREIGS